MTHCPTYIMTLGSVPDAQLSLILPGSRGIKGPWAEISARIFPRATHWIVPMLRPGKCETLNFQPAGRYLYTFPRIVRNINCHTNPLFDPYWKVDSRGSVLFSYISVWQLSF